MRVLIGTSAIGVRQIIGRVRNSKTEFSKRQKFIMASGLQSIVYLLSITVLEDVFWPTFLVSIGAVTAITLWALLEELSDIKYAMLLILPAFFFGAQVFFIRMIEPQAVIVLFSLIFYIAGSYSLLLTQNIYNVAAIRTIQLLRAANAVGFTFTLLCAFFIFSVIWGARASPLVLAILIFSISFPLILQALWSVQLEERLSGRLLGISFLIALLTGQIALAFSFWPILPTIGALALVVSTYVLLSLTQLHLSQKLSSRAIWEYLGVAVLLLIVIMFSTKWGV